MSPVVPGNCELAADASWTVWCSSLRFGSGLLCRGCGDKGARKRSLPPSSSPPPRTAWHVACLPSFSCLFVSYTFRHSPSHAVDKVARSAALLGGVKRRAAGGGGGRSPDSGVIGLPQKALSSTGGAAGLWVCPIGDIWHPCLLRAREHKHPFPHGPRVSLRCST